MKLSIITVVYNNVEGIKSTLSSVVSQDYQHIEYIVVDGNSTDGTVDIVNKYMDRIAVFVSEPDAGIYDALNKGISYASGDVIAILHSGDRFCNSHVCSDMIEHMNKTKSEFCFSDLVIVNNSSGEVLRYYAASYFKKWMFRIGWMPPHPTCFIERHLFDELGVYSTDYKIAGDFDLVARFFYSRKIRWSYLDQVTVRMAGGGLSNSGWESKKMIFNEINSSLRSNNIYSLPIFQLARYAIRALEIVGKFRKNSCS